MPRPTWIRFSDEVAEAVQRGAPVVALESTVIAHGLPAPANLDTALELERIVRAGGATPATVAILEGVAHVGLTPSEIERVAGSGTFQKLSTKDLPVALGLRLDGATTVAATAFVAERAGIHVFATGGIGGVHRGLPPDVSADLTELARTRMLVVSSGAKSILDLPATREVLESLGILVLGWRTDRFPAFYVRETPLTVDARVDSTAEVAAIWNAGRRTDIAGATLVCVPVPEHAALSAEQVENAIDAALDAVAKEGIRGKEVTPKLLSALVRETGGKTLEANRALLCHNAEVAAGIACALAAT